MEKEFKKIYKELKNEFGEKYKPLLSIKVTKSALYMFFAWLIISFVTMFFKRVGLENSSLYIIIDLIEKLVLVILFFMIIYICNKNFEYWGKAFEFKKEVGISFWKKIDKKNEYKIYRNELKPEDVKKELDNMLSDDVTIVDVEDQLVFDNKTMYTVRYDNKDKLRFNGVFVIIQNFSIQTKDIAEYIKSANLNISNILKSAVQKDNKIYILLDAVEVFRYSNKDFFSESELYSNFIRYKEINTL